MLSHVQRGHYSLVDSVLGGHYFTDGDIIHQWILSRGILFNRAHAALGLDDSCKPILLYIGHVLIHASAIFGGSFNKPCVVIGCNNRQKAGGISFFAIPSVVEHQGTQAKQVSQERRTAWLSKINRKNWVINWILIQTILDSIWITFEPTRYNFFSVSTF